MSGTIATGLIILAVIIGPKYRVWIDTHLGWIKPYVLVLMIIVGFGSLLTIFSP